MMHFGYQPRAPLLLAPPGASQSHLPGPSNPWPPRPQALLPTLPPAGAGAGAGAGLIGRVARLPGGVPTMGLLGAGTAGPSPSST